MPPPYSVLYVDDEPCLLELTKAYLEIGGEFRVTTSSKPAEVPGLIGAGSFDAVVSDYLMPRMDGITLLKKIRASGNSIPFIIFTGRGREDVVIEALNNGADFYLQKGGDPESQFTELCFKIRSAVEKRRTEAELLEAHEEIRRKFEEEQFVSEFSQFLLNAATVDGILDFFGDRIVRISGADYLMLAKLDPSGNTIGIHSLRGPGTFLPQIGRLISKPPESLSVPMEYIRAHADIMPLGPGLKTLDGGIYTLSRGFLPKAACTAIERLLGVTGMNIYELVWSGTLYGSVTFAFREGREIRNPGLVTTMCNLLANGLWRIYTADAVAAERQSLAESEVKWRSLVNTSLDGIIIIDFSGTLLFANERARSYFDPEEYSEMRGRANMLDFLSVQSKVDAVRDMANVFAGRDSYLVTYQVHVPKKGDLLINCMGKKIVFDNVPAVLLTIHDITEQNLAEEEISRKNRALIESEERFRELADMLPQVVFETDENLVITYANQYGLKIMGPDRAVEDTVSILEFIDPAQHEDARRNVRDILGGEPDKGHEYTAVRHDGTTFPALVYAAPVFRNRTLAGFRGIAIDITERKTIEEALRMSEKKYRDIIENMQDVVYRADISGKLTMFSPYGVTLAGYDSEEEMIGLDIAADTYRHPEQREQFLAALREKGSVDNYPLVLKTKDGRPRYVTVSSHFFHDDHGQVLGIEGIIHDMTERIQAEEGLRESERKFTTVFRSNPVTQTLVSAPDGRFADVNDAFVTSTGFGREEVIGKTAEELNIFPDVGEYARYISRIREESNVQGVELSCRIKNGEIRICRFSSAIIRMGGVPHVLSSIEDITGRKRG